MCLFLILHSFHGFNQFLNLIRRPSGQVGGRSTWHLFAIDNVKSQTPRVICLNSSYLWDRPRYGCNRIENSPGSVVGALKASHLRGHDSTTGLRSPRCSRRSIVFFHLDESIPNIQPHVMPVLLSNCWKTFQINKAQGHRSLFNPILTWDISGQAYTKPSTWPFHLDGSQNIRTVLDIISHHPAPCLILSCIIHNPPQARRERSLWRQHLDARARDFRTTAAEICWQGWRLQLTVLVMQWIKISWSCSGRSEPFQESTWPVYDSTLVALEDEARPGKLGQPDQTGKYILFEALTSLNVSKMR